MVLIFGDEVQISGSAINGRIQAEFRNRQGFIGHDHLGLEPGLELYFIDVGQEDSTFVVTPECKKILIDGGLNRRALGYLAWKYRLDKDGSPVEIDLLVLSHADGDHLDGLIPIIKHPKIRVHKIVHSGIATYQSGTFVTSLGDLDPSETYLTARHDRLDDLDGQNLSDSFDSWRQAIVDEEASYIAVDVTTGSLDVGRS